MTTDIMTCGCIPNGLLPTAHGMVRGCQIHECTTVASRQPDLTGRQARCSCGRIEPSDPEHLAFFEFCGPGSREATLSCECGYHKIAHDENRIECRLGGFKPRGPREFDRFYCGHHGWD